MIRRRPRSREIAFSFDSFLDLVANVVGIIIRLILVAWVGARAYTGLRVAAELAKNGDPARPEAHKAQALDPLERELAEHRRQLEEARARLLEQLKQLALVRNKSSDADQRLQQMEAQMAELRLQREALDKQAKAKNQITQAVVLSLDELRDRQKRLMEEIRALEKLPPLKKVLRYRVPVSQPVDAEQFMFECRGGRVTFLDMTSLEAEIRSHLEEHAQQLKENWNVTDYTAPVGAFRLKYVVERLHDSTDVDVGDKPVSAEGGFRYTVSRWLVEPVASNRGEALDQALQANSEFRSLVDRLDPQQAVVTFWVYPDSFAVYRRLRDYLYDRHLVVAGRPLDLNMPIGFSPSGTRSRGQ